MSKPVYAIGIDLGTTNTVVAYTNAWVAKGQNPEIKIFEIPQVVDQGIVERRKWLPSFLLTPGEHGVKKENTGLPWEDDNEIIVGEFARERGGELPNRLIYSSKSWLCSPLVDRNKKILPWNGNGEESCISPVEAASMILCHIRNAWNYSMAKDDPMLKIQEQEIFLTVPASFDAVAKDLTVKAAEAAGLVNITLLEEPQAAFYSWIDDSEGQWRNQAGKGDLILVCDLGGGTTDFSLIRVGEEKGDLALERIAVGEHLLLGGDNLDLALAYQVAGKLAQSGTMLDSWQMRCLTHECRKAKEALLMDDGLYHLTILGRGTGIIGGTIKTDLSSEESRKMILDGFFPMCGLSDSPNKAKSTGLRELGLSYESDPSITKHLAVFLRQGKKAGDGVEMPTAILFNGGIMKSDLIRERLLSLVSSWAGREVREIKNTDLDGSVALGAAYYGFARTSSMGVRIRSGLARSYYMGIAASMPAVPGVPPPMKALCVAPFGAEEGSEFSLDTREFVLRVGEPVKFDILASNTRFEDAFGLVIESWIPGEIVEMASIETILEGEAEGFVPVVVEIKITEVGTVEFFCVAKDDRSKRWKLEFNVREKNTFG